MAYFCINVDSPDEESIRAARHFSTNLQLQKCYTGFFRKDSNVPSFGQLGCSGFIISKPDGSIVVPKSPPYLHYRDDAFNWMIRFFEFIQDQQEQEIDSTRVAPVTTSSEVVAVARTQLVEQAEEDIKPCCFRGKRAWGVL
jgi:hypothetical protein